ncbi:MAG: OmpA family protein [Sneathiellaceae bacterium]
MNKLLGMAGVAAACVMLAACGTRLETASTTVPSGTDFDTALFGEYVELSKFEYGEADYGDSDYYADRAILVAKGEAVEPAAMDSRALPAGTEGDLSAARQRLTAALASGAKGGSPKPAARAQAMFDCWMEQQEEAFQSDDIAYCRAEFEKAMALLKPMAKAPDARSFRVYFASGSSSLDKTAMETVANAAKAFGMDKFANVALYGYTDTVGNVTFNENLAAQRVTSVRKALTGAGIPESAIKGQVRGEFSLPKPTADGVNEPANRLVIVRLAP